MLSITYQAVHQLSSSDMDRLSRLVDPIDLSDVDEFLEYPEDEHDFEELFNLLTNPIKKHSAIGLDWKWEPDYLFKLLENVPTGHNIKLVQSDNSQAANIYSIVFKLDGFEHSLEVFDDNPGQILEYLNSLIGKGQFITIDFQGDYYAWLFVPRDFNKNDLEELCLITGCKIKDSVEVERVAKKPNINLTSKQSFKIFFKPHLQVIGTDSGYELPSTWAGRVLPGQTLKEGIALELKEVYKYTGRFEFKYIYFLDYAKDRHDKDIARYGIYVTLFPTENDTIEIS